MKYEELKKFKEEVADPAMRKIFARTEIPEGSCFIDKLNIEFIDGRSYGVDSLIEASGYICKQGQVQPYFYSETDVSVDDFVAAHRDCSFMCEGKLHVFDGLSQFEIHTDISNHALCTKVFDELKPLAEMNLCFESFVYQKMKHLQETQSPMQQTKEESQASLDAYRGSFQDVKDDLLAVIKSKDQFGYGYLANVQAPDLSLVDAFKLYAQLRGETDGAKTLFLAGPDKVYDLSQAEVLERRLVPYDLQKIMEPYLLDVSPLEAFIEQEVPFRLDHVLGVKIDEKDLSTIVEAVKENSDVMFDHDRFDTFLTEQVNKLREAGREVTTFDPEKQGIFIFDEELLVNGDLESVNGYLWAIDALVDRIPGSDDMENINFYAGYQAKTGYVSLEAVYWTRDNGKEVQKCVDIALSRDEEVALLAAMEAYCRKSEGQSLQEMVNACRAEYDLGPLPAPKQKKPALQSQIQKAAAQQRTPDPTHSPSNPFPVR